MIAQYLLIKKDIGKDELGIRKITDDILIALEFKNRDSHYTNTGTLLADKNNYRGIDIVRFGETINIILDQRAYEQMSILEENKQAIEKYRQYYQR